MKIFTCSYYFGGKHYSVDLEAEDEDDAANRLAAIGGTGKVDGELVLGDALERLKKAVTRMLNA